MPKKDINTAKVALITGAGRRVGAEIARVLHEQGMNVVLHYNSSAKEAKNLCMSLNKKRENSAAILAADLAVHVQLAALIEKTVKIWGRLDALVNNASIFNKSQLGDISSIEWDNIDIEEDETKTIILNVRVNNDVDDGDVLRLDVEAGDDEDSETTRIED